MQRIKLTLRQTRKFAHLWNKANGYSDGVVDEANMRIVEAGLVTWSEYDAPNLDLNQVIKLLKEL